MRADVLMTVPPVPDPQALETRRVLIVEPLTADLVFATARVPFAPQIADGFAAAKVALMTNPPDLLITPLRLGAFNGLHLVLRGKTSRPDMAAVVLSEASDGALRREAEALGATFIVLPVAPQQLQAAIMRVLLGRSEEGPVQPPYERRVAVRRGHAIEVAAERRVKDRRRDFGSSQALRN